MSIFKQFLVITNSNDELISFLDVTNPIFWENSWNINFRHIIAFFSPQHNFNVPNLSHSLIFNLATTDRSLVRFSGFFPPQHPAKDTVSALPQEPTMQYHARQQKSLPILSAKEMHRSRHVARRWVQPLWIVLLTVNSQQFGTPINNDNFLWDECISESRKSLTVHSQQFGTLFNYDNFYGFSVCRQVTRWWPQLLRTSFAHRIFTVIWETFQQWQFLWVELISASRKMVNTTLVKFLVIWKKYYFHFFHSHTMWAILLCLDMLFF